MSSPDLERMATQLQRLTGIEEIERVKNANFRCMEPANIDELRDLLTEDYTCSCVGGDYEYTASGRDEFLSMTCDSFNAKRVTQHNAHNLGTHSK